MERTAYAWISADTLASWGVTNPMNRIRIHVTGDALDKKHIGEVSSRAKGAASDMGLSVAHVSVPEPGRQAALGSPGPFKLMFHAGVPASVDCICP